MTLNLEVVCDGCDARRPAVAARSILGLQSEAHAAGWQFFRRPGVTRQKSRDLCPSCVQSNETVPMAGTIGGPASS